MKSGFEKQFTKEDLALEMRNRLMKLKSPALEMLLPEVYNELTDIINRCCEIYCDQYIRERCKKDCCD